MILSIILIAIGLYLIINTIGYISNKFDKGYATKFFEFGTIVSGLALVWVLAIFLLISGLIYYIITKQSVIC